MNTIPSSLSALNPNQRQAVLHREGPLLIIAGPGSGKTFTLVERIVYLISQGVEPSKIMVSTFTEKAAKELVTRASNRLLQLGYRINLNEMFLGTLHSIFLRWLENHREHTRLKRNYRILDLFDQTYLVYRNLKSFLEIDGATELFTSPQANRWQKSQDVVFYLNKVSEECIDLKKLQDYDQDNRIQAIGGFYQTYLALLEEQNALDFSTIQTEILYLLETNPKVLESLQDAVQYIMVDEYQDTNTIQERILFLLAKKHRNIAVVGDDDQGLYRFRGATIRNILEFPKAFPGCNQVELYTNYRSHPEIVQFYNRWMNELDWTHEGQQFRFDKTIKAREGVFPDTAAVVKVACEGDYEAWYQEVFEFLQHLTNSGKLTDLNQVAFLFRSVKNENVLGLSHYLEERGINVFSPRSSLFFEREEVQLLFGCLFFIFPDWKQMLQYDPERTYGIWTYYEACLARFVEELKGDPVKHAELLKWGRIKAKAHMVMADATNYAFAALIYQMLEYPMFAEFLNVDLNSNKKDLRPAYNIALLTKLLFKFEYLYHISVIAPKDKEKILRNLFNDYFRFLYDGGIEEFEDFDEYAPSGCVSFMTIHQSKGLEFPVTLVGSINLVPRKDYDDIDQILQNEFYAKPPFEPIENIKNYDFWRLFYTAFSRPQNLLALTCRIKEGQGKSPSRYFDRVFRPLPSWRDPAFDVSKLDFEAIKPVNIKHEYSFTSHILLYENCPLQYKFYKELEFTEVRTGGVLGGSLLHQTIEDIHKAVLRGEEKTLTDENITQWFDTNYYLLSKAQRSYLHEAQQRALLIQILRYRDRNADKWHRIKEAEVDVSLVKDDYILKGAIDLIEGENGTVEIIDFKSGDKPDVNARDQRTRQQLEQYRRQLEIYAHLVHERSGQHVSRMHLYYPKVEDGIPTITFDFNHAQIAQTIGVFDEVVRKIKSKDYDMGQTNKTEKLCGNCDMRFHCNPKQYQK
ncbi:MAG: ATP-dependent DNA helicase [Saprospiraceae bacterium]|nr:ATP-dependent DNA helicase [Saprospiraceae bacterium]